jgi:peptidoglycan/LPS O-acetylase OafA/YrhL
MGKRVEIRALTGLRGVAALMVVGLHGTLMFGRPEFATAEGVRQIFMVALFPGNSAVVLFFLLSGFVLSLTIPEQPLTAVRHFLGYAIKRVCRIVPALWFAVAFSVLVNMALGQVFDWNSVARALVFKDYSIDPPLWSLRVEFYLSMLALPPIAVATRYLGAWGNAALQAMLLYFVWNWDGLLGYACMFHLGCLVPTLGRWIIDRLRGVRSVVVYSIALAALSAASPALYLAGDKSWNFVTAAMIPGAFLAVSYFSIVQHGRLVNLLSSAPALFIGNVSYSVYVLHWPVRSLIGAGYFHYFPRDAIGFPLQALFVMLLVIASLGLSYVVYNCVELPFIRLGRRAAHFVDGLRVRTLRGTDADDKSGLAQAR